MSGRRNPHLERLRLLRPVRWRLAAAVLCMALAVAVQLAFPKAVSYFVDHLPALAAGVPASWIALAVVAVLLQAAVSMLRHYLFQSAGVALVDHVRRRLFGAMLNQPIAFFDKHHAGELNSRLGSDVQALQQAMTMEAAVALQSMAVLLAGAVLMLDISPLLGLVLALFVPATMWLGKVAGEVYRQHAGQVQDLAAESAKTAQEHFSNVRLVHAYNQQPLAQRRYAAALGRMTATQLAMLRRVAVFRGISSLLLSAALLLTLGLGATLIGRGAMTVGDLAAFVIYSGMVTGAASNLSEFWASWMRSIGATERIVDILHREPPPAAAGGALQLRGDLAFRAVSFAYPERPHVQALAEVSFALRAGEKIALVGASGSGKSTIAALLLGWYTPSAGAIVFDGRDAAGLALADIRRHIGLVEQEPSLFSGTIAENIAFALPERAASLEEVMAAARLANAHDFISAFPDGYATLVGERGVQLSGGQKQRVAIARAALRNPRILILDEATSALDAASEQQVQRALDQLMQGRTTLIIAHRFSTIMKADRVLVMAGGRLCQQGSHAELSQQPDGCYLGLMRNQLLGAAQLAGAA